MKFIGVDLGWSSGATGLACLQWQVDYLEILELTLLEELEDILAWIDRWLPEGEAGLVAVDAPTLIPNATGTRLSDRLTHQYFGRYHAGCYPANLGRPFAARTVGFGESLRARGFRHAPTIKPQEKGRYQIEVFPHPATVNLFDLPRILKYKKGKLGDRLAELQKLRKYIVTILPQITPKLSLNSLFPSIEPKITTKKLKSLEDRFDSLLCAYIAAHWWFWGSERNLVLGNGKTGYIVIPQRYDINSEHDAQNDQP
jgi:predicted RNase H-like nuclease